MDIRQDTLKAYLETEDPIHWIWEEVCKIYNPDSYPEDISRFYEEREQALNVFERLFYETFFEAYHLILEQSLKHRNLKVQGLFGDSSFILIADAMSLREALLFKEYLRLDGAFELLWQEC